MIKALLLLVIFGNSNNLHAEGFLKDFSTINRLIGQDELDKLTTTKEPQAIPGSLFVPLLPPLGYDTSQVCTEEVPVSKIDDKNNRYEIVFVGRVGVDPSSSKALPDGLQGGLQVKFLQDVYGPNPKGRKGLVLHGPGVYRDPSGVLPNSPETNPAPVPIASSAPELPDLKKNLDAKEIQEQAKMAYEFMQEASKFYYMKKDYGDAFDGAYDPNSIVGRQYLIEGIVHAAAASNLSEKKLAEKVAGIIKDTYKTEEQQYQALSDLSNRFYRDYNKIRNPGRNNAENNPDGKEIPKGDLSLNDMFKASANYDTFSGGVCNDISEQIALIAEQVFKTDDKNNKKSVFTVNSGSHFGVVVAGKNGNRVIDGPYMYQMENDLYLQPNSGVPNLHISKVIDGKLKEVAVVDTQIGQFSEAVFDTGKTLLMASNYANTLVGHLNGYAKTNDGTTHKGSLSVGVGGLNRGSIVMVVAKYETKSKVGSSHLGVGIGALRLPDPEMAPRYQIQVRTGSRINLFHFINNKAEVRVETGIQGEAMFALDNDLATLATSLDFGWALEWVNRAIVNYGHHDPKGIQISASAEVRSGIAPKNWGDATGTMSTLTGDNVLKTIGSLNFYVNQVNGNVTVAKEITDAISAQASVNYQGSNIGQSISAMTGVTVKAPEGAQIMVFVGYANNQIPGYQSDNSLLVGPNGGIVGSGLKIKRGPAVKGQVRGLGTERVSGDIMFEMPIDSAK